MIDAIPHVVPIRKQLHAADSDPRDGLCSPRQIFNIEDRLEAGN
jgi:hypothetical protein